MPRPSPAEAQGTPRRRVRSSARPPGGGAGALVTWVVLGRHLAGGEEEPRGTVPQSSPAGPGLRVTEALTRARLPAASGVTAWEQQDPRKCLQGHNMP